MSLTLQRGVSPPCPSSAGPQSDFKGELKHLVPLCQFTLRPVKNTQIIILQLFYVLSHNGEQRKSRLTILNSYILNIFITNISICQELESVNIRLCKCCVGHWNWYFCLPERFCKTTYTHTHTKANRMCDTFGLKITNNRLLVQNVTGFMFLCSLANLAWWMRPMRIFFLILQSPLPLFSFSQLVTVHPFPAPN